jgi:hypothetical protein
MERGMAQDPAVGQAAHVSWRENVLECFITAAAVRIKDGLAENTG